jgi:soluble epoxide hydrolase / lipid-phosphate phosphatase
MLFPTNISTWDRDFANLGAARSWLNANKTTPPPAYLTEKDIDVWMTAFSQPNATETSLNYYKTVMYGIQAADEEDLTDEDRTLTVPVLAVGGTKDLVTRVEELEGQLKPWAPNGFTIRTLETSHWMMWEDPVGLSSILLEFAAE